MSPTVHATIPLYVASDPNALIDHLCELFGLSIASVSPETPDRPPRTILYDGDSMLAVQEGDVERSLTLVAVSHPVSLHARLEDLPGNVGPLEVHPSGATEFLYENADGLGWLITDDDPWDAL